MLSKYKSIIYKNEDAEKKVIDDCIKFVIDLYPNIDPNEVMDLIFNIIFVSSFPITNCFEL